MKAQGDMNEAWTGKLHFVSTVEISSPFITSRFHMVRQLLDGWVRALNVYANQKYPEINQLCKTMQPPLPVYLLMNPLSCSVVAYVCRLDPFQYFYGSHPHRFPTHFTAIMDESCWRKHTLATHNSGCPPLTAQLISELLGWILDAKRAIFQQSHSDSMHTAVTFVRWYPHTKVPQQVALQPISPVNPCNPTIISDQHKLSSAGAACSQNFLG